ncbi:MAG: glutamine synthetase [Fimbriimonadaceae bacterium]|nr:glutamine synthetase [Fimbriimonadaceae bacterium]QYK58511.1 MAG: glutamine synthetase [Fimbriimonadaceae bacterium]
MTTSPLRHFLEIPYDQLEEMNLAAKKDQLDRVDPEKIKERCLKYLADTRELKAVTVCFSDIEGRFHMLDYDKKFLLRSHDNLTFDGSSVRGFSQVMESDLRLEIDWPSIRWLPSDVFGSGKVIVFGIIRDRDGSGYSSDMRGRLKDFSDELWKKGQVANIAVECEGFLFESENAEQNFRAQDGFQLVHSGGYFHSLPNDPLKLFIDQLAEVQRALGFENEKDHPEVAPSQFELNYSYTEALLAADQLQLYKLTARQVAANMGCTASFLPKPISGINGSGMHTNISISQKGTNLFYDAKGEEKVSKMGWEFIDRLLNSANDMCLVLNPSVNAYRRLDPSYEAPNQIKSSAVDRTSMVRIPLGNEQSARVEVRTVAPDASPYLAFLVLLKTGLEGPMTEKISSEERKTRTRYLPDNIYDAVRHFKSSDFMASVLGQDVKDKFVERKLASADRCPRALGSVVKEGEILYHHEVTNQYLWSKF